MPPRDCQLSAPELPRRQHRPLGERFELRPRDLMVHAATEPAVGRCDDALLSHETGEALDALGHQLRMLDHVGGVTHDARQDELAVRELDVLPHLPLVLVTHVAGFERIGAALTASITSTMSRIGMSVVCGPCQLPQQRWNRMRSSGRPLIAWLSASTRTIESFL